MNQHDRRFDGVARGLIRQAARRAPPELSERLREEWLADLTARSGGLSQLRFALGCCWATTVIAHEFGAPVRAAAAAAGNKTTALHDAGWPLFPRRTTVILLIIGLHVLVVCVLATGIVPPRALRVSPPRIDVSFLPKPAPPVPPAPAEPTFAPFRFDLPAPHAPTLATEVETVTNPVQVTPAPGPPAAPSLPTPVNRVQGGPGAGFPNTDDFYPQASRRLGEQGSATINVCVDGTGRLIGKPTIGESSGSTRLDEGALRLAKAGSGHYQATTEDGRGVSACYPFRVRFHLRD